MNIKLIKWLCINSFLILKYIFYADFILICLLYKVGHIPVIVGYLFWFLCGLFVGALIYRKVTFYMKMHIDNFI